MESKKGHRPSSRYIESGIPRRTLRPWADVARMFNEQTGESLTEVQAKSIGLAAIAKMAKVLDMDTNRLIKHAIQSQLFSR